MKKITPRLLFLFSLSLLMGLRLAYAQKKEITGTIIDTETGTPILGANILIKHTTQGTATDFDGRYTIDALPTDTLLISYVGFTSIEQVVGDKTIINIALKPNASLLNEVVVVGYGTQKRTNVTGAVATVKMADALGDRPIASTAQLLQGTSPGLQVVTGNGRPGQNSSINIRGFTSINGGSPLILVDNAEVPNINDINPADIESVSLLKDASSAAIYGARGAFGVVLVTTKKGQKNQKPKITYTSNTAVTYATDLAHKLNTYETVKTFKNWELISKGSRNIDTWLGLLEDYQINPQKYPNGQYFDDSGIRYPLIDGLNWWDNAFTNGLEQIHNLSYTGGSSKTKYRVSLGYTDQDGIMITDKDSYKRYNVNLNLSTDLTDRVTAFINVFYKNALRKRPNQYGNVFARGSYIPPYVSSGYGVNPGTGETLPYGNPYNLVALQPYVSDYGDDIRLNGKVAWNVFKNFTFTTDYTYNKTNNYNKSVTTAAKYLDTNDELINLGNRTSFYKQNGTTQYQALNLLAEYKNSFGNHNIKFLTGANYEEAKNEAFNGRRYDLISVDLPGLNTGTGDQIVNDSYYQWAVAGYLARLNYNYKERYLIELVSRYDGSSRFAPSDRFTLLPSASAGWVATKENFMEHLKPIVSFLKFRGSYGQIGNQRVTSGNVQDYYPYLPTFPTYNTEWVDPNDTRYVTLGTPQLVSAGFTWEKVRTLNLAVEFGFFKDRLTGTFERYNREVIGALDDAVELPGVLGTVAPKQNVVNTLTKGWELTLNWKGAIGEDFKYSIGGNLYDSRAFITKIDNTSGNIRSNYVGKEIGEIWGYETVGFYGINDFEEETAGTPFDNFTLKDGVVPFENFNHKPGDVKFADLNGDGVVSDGLNTLEDHGDLKRIGNSRRRYQYGITGSAEYKNLNLSFFLQGVGKRNRHLFNYANAPFVADFSNAVLESQLDTWTPEHQNAFWPRVGRGDDYRRLARKPSSKYLYDASYLTIKNITLGYNIPKRYLEKIGLSSLRFALSGENLHTFDKLPEGINSDQSIESAGFGYPYTKKYSLSINLSF